MELFRRQLWHDMERQSGGTCADNHKSKAICTFNCQKRIVRYGNGNLFHSEEGLQLWEAVNIRTFSCRFYVGFGLFGAIACLLSTYTHSPASNSCIRAVRVLYYFNWKLQTLSLIDESPNWSQIDKEGAYNNVIYFLRLAMLSRVNRLPTRKKS